MARKFSERSLRNLDGVHPDLVRVIERALQTSPLDFIVIEGLRTKARQQKLVDSGASKTLNSRHITGHAVDLLPIGYDGVAAFDWPLYDKLGPAVKEAAHDLGVQITWGGDWRSFRDGPHFELTRDAYPENEPWPASDGHLKAVVDKPKDAPMMGASGIFSGYKTYIVGAAIIVVGVVEGALGYDIPGASVGDDWMLYVLNGLGLGSMRAGIAKAALGFIRR